MSKDKYELSEQDMKVLKKAENLLYVAGCDEAGANLI